MDTDKIPSMTKKLGNRLLGSRKARLLTAASAVLVMVLAVAGGFAVNAALDPYDCRILPDVTLGGIEVGGMTRREAREVLEAETRYAQEYMTVVLPEQTLSLGAETTRVRLNISGAVSAAYDLGRKVSPEQGLDLSLLPYLKMDTDAITAVLQSYAEETNVAYSDYSFCLSGEAPVLKEDAFDPEAPCQTLLITTGTPRIELDVAAVLEQILQSYGNHRFLVEIPRPQPLQEAPLVDLESVYRQVSQAPVDTGVNREAFSLIPGAMGYDFDPEEAAALLAAAQPGETVTIPMRYVKPEVLGEEAYFQDVLGSCETPHTADENRNTNLRMACASLDGLILWPGEEFSYNQTLGERTKDRGYKPAPAYSGTDLVASYGGGICQGSSTLYYCTLLADLEILERVSHGYEARYIQIGCDATVSWWGPDFRFRNNTNFPIMIKAEVSDGYVRMQLLGTDEKDYYIEMESEVRGTSQTHRYVKTYKLKYDKETGELLSRDYEASSSYLPSYF